MMTEQNVLDLVKEARGSSKYMSDEAMTDLREKVTRSAKRTGWNTKRFDGTMAKMINEGKLKVKGTNTAVGTEMKREQATNLMNATTEQEVDQLRTMARVKKWIDRRATKGTITEPMMKTMEQDLTQKGKSTTQTAAAIMMVAYKGRYKVEARRLTRGGAQRDWIQEAMTWAQNEKWITKAKAKRIVATLTKRNNYDAGRKEEIAVDIGSGWGGATEGLEREYDRVVGMDAVQQTILREKKAALDLKGRFENKRKFEGGVVRYMEQQGGIKRKELMAIWGSPCCTEETKTQRGNKGKPWGAGEHAGIKRSQGAQQALDTIREGVVQARERDPTVQWCLENPAETAILWDKKWMKEFGEGMEVHGCPYGKKSAKKYHLWMSKATEAIFKEVQVLPKDPKSLCETCKKGLLHSETHSKRKGDPRPRLAEEGKNQKAARNRVPPNLAELVGRCMKEACLKERKKQERKN